MKNTFNNQAPLAPAKPIRYSKLTGPWQQRSPISDHDQVSHSPSHKRTNSNKLKEELKRRGVLSPKIDKQAMRHHDTANHFSSKTNKEIPFIIQIPGKKKNGKEIFYNTQKPITSSLLELRSYEEFVEPIPEKDSIEIDTVLKKEESSQSYKKYMLWASEDRFNSHLNQLNGNYENYLWKLKNKKNIYVVPQGVVADPHDYGDFYRVDHSNLKVDNHIHEEKEDPKAEQSSLSSANEIKGLGIDEQVALPQNDEPDPKEVQIESPLILPIDDSNEDSTVKNNSEANKSKNRSRFSSKELSRLSPHSKLSRNNTAKSKKKLSTIYKKTSTFSQNSPVSRNSPHKTEVELPVEIKVQKTDHTTSGKLDNSFFGEFQNKRLNSEEDQKPNLEIKEAQSELSKDFSISIANSRMEIPDGPKNAPTNQDLPPTDKIDSRQLRKTPTAEFVMKKDYVKLKNDYQSKLKQLESVSFEDEEELVDIFGSQWSKDRETRIPFHKFNFYPKNLFVEEKNPFSNSHLLRYPSIVCSTYRPKVERDHLYWEEDKPI